MIVSLLSAVKARMHFEDPASALCAAAGTGDLAQVKRIIENGVDPNVGDYDRRTGMIPCTGRNLGSVSLASAAWARRRDLSTPPRPQCPQILLSKSSVGVWRICLTTFVTKTQLCIWHQPRAMTRWSSSSCNPRQSPTVPTDGTAHLCRTLSKVLTHSWQPFLRRKVAMFPNTSAMMQYVPEQAKAISRYFACCMNSACLCRWETTTIATLCTVSPVSCDPCPRAPCLCSLSARASRRAYLPGGRGTGMQGL
jgi:hypothetical protein